MITLLDLTAPHRGNTLGEDNPMTATNTQIRTRARKLHVSDAYRLFITLREDVALVEDEIAQKRASKQYKGMKTLRARFQDLQNQMAAILAECPKLVVV